MNKKFLFILSVAVVAGFSSCKDDEEDPPPPAPVVAAPANPNPAPTDAFGALVAIKTANYVDVPFFGTVNQAIGVAVGVFGDLTTATYVDAGTVSSNGSSLTKQTNSSYIYTPAAALPTGIDYGDDVSWNVTGNTTTGVPAIVVSPVNQMPSDPNYAGSATLGRTSDFTLSSSVAITGADSVIFSVIGNGVSLLKTKAGSEQSAVFTAAEMATIPVGNGYIQIVPYNISSSIIEGKKIYFVNETVITKSVTFN